MITVNRLVQETLRANPAYELLLLDRLPVEKQAYLLMAHPMTDIYGVLQPRAETALPTREVNCATALLFLSLQSPGLLPRYVRQELDEARAETILKGVLDGVFEVETAQGFVSGAAALRALSPTPARVESQGRLDRLSIEALQYTAALQSEDPALLSSRLYYYHRVPASARWRGRLRDRKAVADYLGLQPGSPAMPLETHWEYNPPTLQEGWHHFTARQKPRSASHPRRPCKLYISPLCEYLPEALEKAVPILARSHAAAYKVGVDLHGLLRPDKMVAYFSTFEEMQATGKALQTALRGTPPQGVPFTAALNEDGLLSWGADPPYYAFSPLGGQAGSWRTWLLDQLAAALATAKSTPDGDGLEPWRYALQRVRLEGVNTSDWTPNVSIWDKYAER